MSANRIIIFLVVLLFGLKANAKEFDYSGIVLDHVVIQGRSNISDFMLTFMNDRTGHHNLVADEVSDSTVHFKIPVEYITASNRLLVTDFRKIIKADEYPYIDIRVNKQEIKSIAVGQKSDNLKIVVTLAGESKSYLIPYTLGRLPEDYEYIMGKTDMCLTDFDLEPAKKIFGFIKISNEVFINFKINFKSS